MSAPHEFTKANRIRWTFRGLYGNGAFYSLTARRKGSCVTIPLQIPKSPFYYVRLYNLVWQVAEVDPEDGWDPETRSINRLFPETRIINRLT